MNVMLALTAGVCGGAAGFFAANRLAQREEALAEMLCVLDEIAVKIRWLSLPIAEFITESSDRYIFIQRVEENMKVHGADDFPGRWRAAWNAAVDGTAAFQKEDKQLLKKIGGGLGATDVEGQIAILTADKALLSEYHDRAKNELNRKGRMFRQLGLLLGFALAVLCL